MKIFKSFPVKILKSFPVKIFESFLKKIWKFPNENFWKFFNENSQKFSNEIQNFPPTPTQNFPPHLTSKKSNKKNSKSTKKPRKFIQLIKYKRKTIFWLYFLILMKSSKKINNEMLSEKKTIKKFNKKNIFAARSSDEKKFPHSCYENCYHWVPWADLTRKKIHECSARHAE